MEHIDCAQGPMGRIISDRSVEEDIKISNEGRAREIVTKILSLKLKVFFVILFSLKMLLYR